MYMGKIKSNQSYSSEFIYFSMILVNIVNEHVNIAPF